MKRSIVCALALMVLLALVWPVAYAQGSDGQIDDQTPPSPPAGKADRSDEQRTVQLETWITTGQYGYTGASTTDEAAVFDLATWTLVERVDLLPEGDYPYDATIKPDGGEVWIPGAVGDGVVVIDTATNQVTQRIAAVGEYAIGVAFRQDGAYAFVSNRNTEDVAVIDTASYAVVDTIPIPTHYLGAGNLALNPCSGEIYLVDWYDDHFFVLDAEAFTVTQEIALGNSLWQLVVHPQGDFLYITDRGSDNVHVIDTATLGEITTVPVGDDPWGIDITPDGTLIYVTNEDSHDVTAIDAANNTVITTVGLPHGSDSDPRDVDFSVDGAYAYVTSGGVTGDDEVYVIDTASHTVVGQINVAPAANPNVVAVAPQMASCSGLVGSKDAGPDPVVLGDPLTYTVGYLYTAPTPTLALVTDTLPVGTAYLSSSGGLSSTYDIGTHRVIWYLGTVPPGGGDTLTAKVLPVDEALAGQEIGNHALLDFGVTTTAAVSSTVLTPALAIRFPDGTAPPDPLPTCEGEVVTLTAVSNRQGPLAYHWDLGDGTVADTPTVTHSWFPGSYVVLLSTTNAYGWVESDTLSLEVDPAPVAGFLSNSPVELGQPARFTDTSAYTPTAWQWDFGDGVGSSTEPNPTYTYTATGVYTVTLLVTNDCGSDSHRAPFEVLVPPCQPLEAVTITGPLVLEVGQAGLYTATYAPPTATQPVTTTWDSGTVGPNAVYSWTVPGTYTISVTATNPCDVVVGDDLVVEVLALPCRPLEAVTITGPLVLEVGQAGLYTATYTPPTATQPVTTTWDSGTVGPNAVYSWTVPGSYTISVTATNPCDVVVGDDLVVEVLAPPCRPLEAVTITGPLVLEVGQAGLYTATYAPPTATLPVTTTWDSGTVGPNAVYSWTVPGSYTISVTATNPCDVVVGDDLVVEVLVLPCRPLEAVTITGPLVLEVGQAGLYTATYAPPTATLPVTTTWDSGTVGPNAVYSWTVPGSYTISVTATNPCDVVVAGNQVVEVQTAAVEHHIYLPLVQRGG